VEFPGRIADYLVKGEIDGSEPGLNGTMGISIVPGEITR
jgi:hypothetical protein